MKVPKITPRIRLNLSQHNTILFYLLFRQYFGKFCISSPSVFHPNLEYREWRDPKDRTSSGDSLVVDCRTALGNLISDLNVYVDTKGIPFLAKVTGLGTRFAPILSGSLDYLLGYTGTAQSFLMHNIFMNQFLIAEASWLQANGVSASQVAVGTALAERQLATQGAVCEKLWEGFNVPKGYRNTNMVIGPLVQGHKLRGEKP